MSNLPGTSTKVDDDDDDTLCSICSTLDLRIILRNGICEERAVSLGRLTDILNKRDQCGLCRLIGTHFSQPGVDLERTTCKLYTMAHRSPFLMNRAGFHHLCIETSPWQSPLEFRFLKESSSKITGPKGYFGRRVGQTVDIGLLKGWIYTCEKEHRKTCETDGWRVTGEILPSTVRVLDVVRMAIVPAPPECRYVALSYVWGGPGDAYWTTQANIKQRGVPGGLNASMMPKTISDTIQLVRQLGEQYVWIDALCIVQDDPEDKRVQIGVMELIYGSSAFTIFAACCSSVRDPLHGVRLGTRDPKQHIAKIQGVLLALPLPDASTVIARSVWNERGWTYQEAMLSRRRVFFTANQVYFECRSHLYSEEMATGVALESPLAIGCAAMGQVIPTCPPFSFNRELYVDFYRTIIGEYTQRRLTMESDIVDAVEALLRGLTKAFKLAGGNYDEAFKFGMLLAGGLEEALLWQPVANIPNSRRVPTDKWPSWSWAAWRGAVKYASDAVFTDVFQGPGGMEDVSETLVEWYIIDHNDGQPVRLYTEYQERLTDGTNTDSEFMNTYIAPKGNIDPQQLMAENPALPPGTLVFRTSYSRFHVIEAKDVDSADAAAYYAIYSILSDIPRPSTKVGRIILPSSTRSPTSYEFVVLSRGGEEGLFHASAYNGRGSYDIERLGRGYSGCMLNVMAVKKMQDEKRFERVGVGIIFEQAWLNSAPEENIIYLG